MTTRRRRGTPPGTCDGPGDPLAARRRPAGRSYPGRSPAPDGPGTAR
ncbi:hypothetical protein [Streptomyces sp. NPDC048737]